MRYIDLHCDTLYKCQEYGLQHIQQQPRLMVDVHRLLEANVMLQVFAVFFPPRLSDGALEDLPSSFDEEILFDTCVKMLEVTIKENEHELIWVKNRSDLYKVRDNNRCGALLSVEDGRIVNGKLENIKKLYDSGVRLMTLTWNHENCFGYPNSNDKAIMSMGLKDFGRNAVQYMNELGMAADVSHLNDAGAMEVINVSSCPVTASHSCCRALNPHPRNLSDELIRAISGKGGVIGINFSPTFVPPIPQTGGKSHVGDMVRHIKHMLDTGGEDCVSIGTDFDGLMGDSEISSPAEMYQLFFSLEKAGISDRIIEKIAWKNAFRFFSECL